MQHFSISAHVLGTRSEFNVTGDVHSGFVLRALDHARTVRSLPDAQRIVHRAIGEILLPAERPGVPWGLHVSVASAQAVYGEWPLLPASGEPQRLNDTPVARIYRQWTFSDGPLKALENAMMVIEAYASEQIAA